MRSCILSFFKILSLFLLIAISQQQKCQFYLGNESSELSSVKCSTKQSEQKCDQFFSTVKVQYQMSFCLRNYGKTEEQLSIKVINSDTAQTYDAKIDSQILISSKMSQLFLNPYQIYQFLKQNAQRILFQQNGAIKYFFNIGKFQRAKVIMTTKRKASAQTFLILLKQLTSNLKQRSKQITKIQSQNLQLKQTMGKMLKIVDDKITLEISKIKLDYENKLSEMNKKLQDVEAKLNDRIDKQKLGAQKSIQNIRSDSNNKLNSEVSNINSRMSNEVGGLKNLIANVDNQCKQVIKRTTVRQCLFNVIMNTKYCRTGKSEISSYHGFKLSHQSSQTLFATTSSGPNQQWSWYQSFDGYYSFLTNTGRSLRVNGNSFFFQGYINRCEQFIRIKIGNRSIFKSACDGNYLGIESNGKVVMNNLTELNVHHGHLWHIEDIDK